MTEKQVMTELEKEIFQAKMERWAKEFPLCCEIMFGTLKGKERTNRLKELIAL